MYISKDLILSVWNKWIIIPWYDPNIFRNDRFGSTMKFNDYGKTDTIYWWEIDHIIPIEHWWTDHLINLQPLQWLNNRKKSDNLM